MVGDGDFRRLGPYVLLRTSGAGGMGRIDLALRAQPGDVAKLCVVKRMHAELRSQEQEARFRREASIAQQLSHTAIAQIVGIEEIDGELLLLQELVHGVDLKLLEARLATAGERVPLPIAVHVVSEIARALAYAHDLGDRGIVHRDVTPDNVMLSFSGEVKLVDFGIARSDVDATLTSTGHIVGRPTYTAPEVWEGARADRRSDIYSLGVVLWQLLTGRPMSETRPMGQRQAPPPSAIVPELPAVLDDVVARALATDPKQRYQQAAELQDALRPYQQIDLRPETALAELLARHFDVTRERQMLARDIEHALPLLSSGGAAAEPTPEPVEKTLEPEVIEPTESARLRVRLRGPRAVAAIAAVGLVLAVAMIAGMRMRASAPNPAPSDVATAPAAPPPVTAPIVVAPPPMPETKDAPPPTGKTPASAHPIATSAGRARPPSAKAARPAAPTAPAVSSEELLRHAQEKFDVGETQVALALARQAATAGARAPAHLLMGKVFMSERRFDEAEHEFAEAVRLDPNDPKAARLLALVRETRSSGP